MIGMTSLIELMLVVFLINLPFGYWRFKNAKFSRGWMMAIHIPVPIVMALRIFAGFGLATIPLLVVAFAGGQFIGGRIRGSKENLISLATIGQLSASKKL